MNPHTYTHVDINSHMHKPTYISTCIHIFTYTQIIMHIYMYTHIHINRHTSLHVYSHIHKCTHLFTCIHIYTFTYICIHMYMYTYIHIYIYKHTYIHAYIYLHIQTGKLLSCKFVWSAVTSHILWVPLRPPLLNSFSCGGNRSFHVQPRPWQQCLEKTVCSHRFAHQAAIVLLDVSNLASTAHAKSTESKVALTMTSHLLWVTTLPLCD